MRCLACATDQRYPLAAHLAFDLTHCDQIQVIVRGRALTGPGFVTHFKRCNRAARSERPPGQYPHSSQSVRRHRGRHLAKQSIGRATCRSDLLSSHKNHL